MAPDTSATTHGRAALPEDLPAARRAVARATRHVAWARTDGLGRLVEEDRLDPRDRVGAAWRAWRWRRTHPVAPGEARVALVLGLQRSGTNMVLREIEADPSVEVHNENDRRVFDRYRLRSDDVLRELAHRSRSRLVLLKCLCDSHEARRLLEVCATPGGGARALWVYRDVDGRAASAVAKFGDANRRVLIELAAGGGADRWQAGGLGAASRELIRSCDPEGLDAHSAAALFWVVRNRLFFDQELDRRSDVLLVSYGAVVASPLDELARVASFLGLETSGRRPVRVDGRARQTRRLELDLRVRRAADELTEQLDQALARRVPGPPPSTEVTP